MSDTMTFPKCLLKVTVGNESTYFVSAGDDNTWGGLPQIGEDVLTLAEELKAGRLNGSQEDIKNWFWYSKNRQNVRRLNFIDWDILAKREVARIELVEKDWADYFYHIDITAKGTIIVGYNETQTKHIRYKVSTFTAKVIKAKHNLQSSF